MRDANDGVSRLCERGLWERRNIEGEKKKGMLTEKYLLIRIVKPHPTGYLMSIGTTSAGMGGRFLMDWSVPPARPATTHCDDHVGEVLMRRRSRKRIYCYGRGTQIRLMLESVLDSGNVVFTCFQTSSECLDKLLTKPCDVLIVELGGNEPPGLGLLTQTRQMAPWISTLAIVENGAVPNAVKAIKNGACECLEKPVQPERMCEAVNGLLAKTASLPHSHRALTQMEIHILQLILAGKTSQDIAEHLCRSKRTIDVHRKNIMRKVQATSLVDLIRRVLAMGLADESGCDPSNPSSDD